MLIKTLMGGAAALLISTSALAQVAGAGGSLGARLPGGL
jgi:hypothetical protein